SEDHLCRWQLLGQPDQLGAEHVWLEHAGDQALSATHLHGMAQTLDYEEDFCLDEPTLFSRSIREDCLHSAHGQAPGTISGTGSKNAAPTTAAGAW
ncbi:MAG: hypothetical protein ACTTKK_10950, partial [Ottowia sp.]